VTDYLVFIGVGDTQTKPLRFEFFIPSRQPLYFGHSGTGFSEKGIRETIERLKPLFTDKPTVENPPKIPEKIQWAKAGLRSGIC
jgi:ATP-dependent DNA ligase